jgi:hypothetical protein
MGVFVLCIGDMEIVGLQVEPADTTLLETIPIDLANKPPT